MGAKRAERTRATLARMLGQAGYGVDPLNIKQKRGTPSSGRHVAVWGWETVARRRGDGAEVTIRCFDTMGACICRGVVAPPVTGPAGTVIVRARPTGARI